MWLSHTFVSLKVNVFLLFAHISSYFILITFLFLALLPDIQMRDSYLLPLHPIIEIVPFS